MKIKLPVFFRSEEIKLEELSGKDRSLKDYEIKEVILYNLNYIAPYTEGGIIYTEIHSGDQSFISLLKINKVEELIDKQINKWELKIN
jgi:hypothetical protein